MKAGIRWLLALNALFFFALFSSELWVTYSKSCTRQSSFWAIGESAIFFTLNIYYIFYHEHVEQWSGKIDRRVRGTDSGGVKD